MPEVDEFTALQSIIKALQPFDTEDRQRIIASAALFLRLPASVSSVPRALAEVPTSSAETIGDVAPRRESYPAFSARGEVAPKEFLFEKQPRTDVERIAVLAYYLTHYSDTPHFKTLDLSKLNTEAAQPKFANTANSAGNAVKQGYLVPSTKGMRQLSAIGERFVAALPDRDAARATMASSRPKRRPAKKAAASKTATSQGN